MASLQWDWKADARFDWKADFPGLEVVQRMLEPAKRKNMKVSFPKKKASS